MQGNRILEKYRVEVRCLNRCQLGWIHWSIVGWCTFLGRNLVMWRSNKQLRVVRSSVEQNSGLWLKGYGNCSD